MTAIVTPIAQASPTSPVLNVRFYTSYAGTLVASPGPPLVVM